jgi:hypothetical protein
VDNCWFIALIRIVISAFRFSDNFTSQEVPHSKIDFSFQRFSSELLELVLAMGEVEPTRKNLPFGHRHPFAVHPQFDFSAIGCDSKER